MQTPKRKPGQYALVKPDYYLTPQAILKLKQDLENILKKRPKVIEEMQLAAMNGDFSENAAYQMAKGKLRGMNTKILEFERKIGNAIPIESGTGGDHVRLGSTVTVQVNGKEKIYQILGAQEADPMHGKISYLSPLGSILINKKTGESVFLENEKGKTEYKIIKIQ